MQYIADYTLQGVIASSHFLNQENVDKYLAIESFSKITNKVMVKKTFQRISLMF